MPTDISVTSTTSRRAPGRLWLGSPHGTDAPIHVTFDFATFTHANFTATGQIQNGCLLGKITASGKYGPYDDTATDGRQTAQGLLFDSENVAAGQTRAVNAILRHGNVDETRLPFETGAGAVDAAAKADLPLIDWK